MTAESTVDVRATVRADAQALIRVQEAGLVWQSVCAITRLDIPDRLTAGPRPVADLASAAGTDADALRRVLRLLAAHGVVTFTGDEVTLTERGRLLCRTHPFSLRAVFATVGLPDVAHALTETVRTGHAAAERVLGTPFWDHLSAHPEQQELFDAQMQQLDNAMMLPTVAALPWPDGATIADLGGGIGTVLAAALNAAPAARGILVEQPGVVGRASAYLAAQGLADRCELHPGDLFEPPPPADLYVLCKVLHNWSDDDAAAILAAVARSATDATRLWVLEGLLPEGGAPHRTLWSDIAMLLLLEGARERTASRFRQLLERTGWRVDGVLHAGAPISVVEARRAATRPPS